MRGAVFALALTGCAWFQQHKAFFPTPDDVACVANEVEQGITDPAQVVKDCPGISALAVADLEALITGQAMAKAARK